MGLWDKLKGRSGRGAAGESAERAVLKLGGHLTLSAGGATDAIAERWTDLSSNPLTTVRLYSLSSQCYFFYLHLVDRLAFSQAGDAGRIAVQEALSPVVVLGVDSYLQARSSSDSPGSISDDPVLVETYFRQLNESSFEYSRLKAYNEMLVALASRVQDAVGERGNSALGEMVEEQVRSRMHPLGELVAEALQGLGHPSRT